MLKISLCSLLVLLTLHSWAQFTVTGSVRDAQDLELAGANLQLKGTNKGTVTGRDGRYEIKDVAAGTYTVVASFVGFATVTKEITVSANSTLNFTLNDDALAMSEVIVTGTFDQRTRLESSVAISTLNPVSIQQRAPRGTGDLLQSVPGVWVDNSSGEVGSKVVARGLSPVGNDQVGFQYVSLQEEGLPVMGAQMGFSLVDMYQRADITTARMEAIRGGSAAITSANSPGGIFNFISKTGGAKFAGSARMTGGLYGNGNGLGRFEAEFGGPLVKGWGYHVGGFYRVDQGARTTPFNANQGGQLKANISKQFANGRGMFKVYGKYLNDQNTFFKEIALTPDLKKGYDPGNGDPVDINYSTTFIDVTAKIPLADEFRAERPFRDNPTRLFDAKRGIQNRTTAVGLDFSYDLGKGWGLSVKGKRSTFDQDYIQYQGNSVLPVSPAVVGSASLGAQQGYLQFGAGALAAASTYATTGALAPQIANTLVPSVLSPTYIDARTNEVLARSNFALVGGVPSSVLDPNTPNKLGRYLLATAPLNMFNKTTDQIAQLSINKELGGHQLTFGTYYSRTEIDTRWFVDGVLSTLGANPRAVRVTFPAPAAFPAAVAGTFAAVPALNAALGGLVGGGTFMATDSNGIVLQSGLAYTVTRNVQQLNAFYLNDVWKVNDKLSIDLGARFETVRHTGVKQGWRGGTAIGGAGGLDRNLRTTYDLGSRVYNGDEFVYGVAYQPQSTTSATLARDASGRIIPANEDVDGDGEGYQFNYLSWSVGANYKFTDKTAGYLRVSRGNKAPELDYYANNFVNIPIDRKAPIETVTQAELGFKASTRKLSFSATGFYSYLDNALLQLFISNGSLSFFTDPTFNATRTVGLELETVLKPSKSFEVRAHATLQDAKYERLTYQNTGGSTDRALFFNEDFSGNRVKDVAPIILDITPTFHVGKFSPYLNYRWFSERQGNRRNSVQLAAYGVLSAGVSGDLTSKFNISVQTSNLLNSAGILLFGGYGLQGTSGEDIAVGGIRRPEARSSTGTVVPAGVLAGTDLNVLNSLNSPVFARPILPRQVTVSVSYKF